ncbi:hypothetical protein L1987_05321 [Smallanthus sonchifolius]|uniref:Uncharacterized protein n=1 Tax=Smallanthus sonchifolius TaxID=185202 RepID=A0ACB9JV13_9ASTR|nr:hypothetical protein L1987_05321 [Smallanthus sonchifolius]
MVNMRSRKKEALEEQNQQRDPHKDLITSLLSIRDDDGSTMMSEDEITDNVIVLIIAGYDTTSVLLTFLVRLLANNKSIYSTIVQVMLSVSMTHMDDSIFQNPTMFDPTRYEKHTPPTPFSYMAFGAGPRMCPGIELAKMETLVMMHRLVTRFSWSSPLKETLVSYEE